MTDIKVGTVTHYYSELGVAIVELIGILHVGDRIKFSGTTNYSQMVEHILIDNDEVDMAPLGETIGLKVSQPVVPGDEVVKLA